MSFCISEGWEKIKKLAQISGSVLLNKLVLCWKVANSCGHGILLELIIERACLPRREGNPALMGWMQPAGGRGITISPANPVQWAPHQLNKFWIIQEAAQYAAQQPVSEPSASPGSRLVSCSSEPHSLRGWGSHSPSLMSSHLPSDMEQLAGFVGCQPTWPMAHTQYLSLPQSLSSWEDRMEKIVIWSVDDWKYVFFYKKNFPSVLC